jgi:hypothetical protein
MSSEIDRLKKIKFQKLPDNDDISGDHSQNNNNNN